MEFCIRFANLMRTGFRWYSSELSRNPHKMHKMPQSALRKLRESHVRHALKTVGNWPGYLMHLMRNAVK